MNEELTAEAPKKRRRPKLSVIIIGAIVLAFAIGLGVEIWKHSDSHIKSLLENDRSAFDACAEYFKKGGPSAYTPTSSDELDPNGQKTRDVTSIETLAERLKDEPIADELEKLNKAGILRISLEGWELRFYCDVNSGICYIDPALKNEPGFYYPEGYLDDNRIDGDFYRFGDGSDKKKK